MNKTDVQKELSRLKWESDSTGIPFQKTEFEDVKIPIDYSALVNLCYYFANYNAPEQEGDFFEQLATAMRKLWPAGEKDGKYSWRDSVSNLTKRLKLLWEIRNLKQYTLDECLTVARRYLSQFEHNAKYMKTLKYFILRQNDRIVARDGQIHYIDQSTFADMLEGQTSFDVSNDWEETFSSSLAEQGEII